MIRSCPREPQPVDRLEDRVRVAQQVAEEHDQAAVPEHAGDLVQARLDLGGPLRLELGQQRQDVAELRPLAPRRQALARPCWSKAIRPTGSCWWIIR